MKKKRYYILLVLMLTVSLGLTGCGGGRQQAIQIKGSDTEVNAVQHLAESFMKNSDLKIAVTGGGSGTGIAALIKKEVDIADASRDMTQSELDNARSNNVNPVRFIVGMDGLSVIVNEDISVNELTIDQIGKIFRGEITNWQEVGGKDLAISLYGRQSNSGTFVFFRDEALKGDYSQNMKRMNGNAQIVESIKADKAGIGYVGVGYAVDENDQVADGIKIVNVAVDDNSPAVSPLKAENVKNGSYPLARPLNQYLNGKSSGGVLDFIKYELSDQGQQIMIDEGFYPVSPKYQKINQDSLNS